MSEHFKNIFTFASKKDETPPIVTLNCDQQYVVSDCSLATQTHYTSCNTNCEQEYDDYEIKITTKDQRHFFYEWKVEIGSEKNCKSCWFTSAVSFPEIKGKNI